ncbi:MAG: DUF2065 domain-containing protein, partial [Proteobacteria bacterium]|nr:DUF2065 domain-containing protein [Pseudomonadota bacterium]
MTLDHLWIALCLVLVIEGLLPFASPKAWKAMVMQAQGLDERSLRIYGLVLMVL